MKAGEILFHLGALALAVLLALLSLRYGGSWDWAGAGPDKVDPQTAALLARLQAPLELKVYTRRDGPLGRRIATLLAPYVHAASDQVRLTFVDPARHPDAARRAGVRLWGELVLGYQGRTQRLETLDTPHIRNAIFRLLHRQDLWIVGLRGHGGRLLEGKGPADLGHFSAALRAQGYRVQGLDLLRHPGIPGNTALVIVPGPTGPLDPVEVEALRAWLKRGGALWWLLDPDQSRTLPWLAQDLGLIALPGTLVDPEGTSRGEHNPLVVLGDYAPHPATSGLEGHPLFPKALALTALPPAPWQAIPLVTSGARAWNETGPLKGAVRLDHPQEGEQRGPLTLALAFTRPRAGGEQRLLVTGDGDFLANAWLGQGDNRAFGLHLVRWLLAEDRLLDLPQAPAIQRLPLDPALALVLGIGSLGLLPLGLAGIGLLVYWSRRRE